MRLCIDPALYEEKARELLAGKRTLAETLHLAFGMIPSERLNDILAYVRGVPIRPLSTRCSSKRPRCIYRSW